MIKHLDNISNKILKINELKSQISFWRQKNHKITFTNGCFDILHKGHIELLCQAADLGDKLIVGLNSDTSIKKIKGDSRPIMPEDVRSKILASLSYIDAVILFSQDTPEKLINEIMPDILVKGGDYKAEEIIGYDLIKSINGEVVILPFINGFSSTSIIKKIEDL
tara:strand:+ start:3810 stop:4304 length:495 start_codon:yes stop_codon:yes gene_type:complete